MSMTTQEQVTIIERWGPSGIQRWAEIKDGKFIELPFQPWMGEPPYVILNFPREENCIEPDVPEIKNEYAIVHLPDRSRA